MGNVLTWDVNVTAKDGMDVPVDHIMFSRWSEYDNFILNLIMKLAIGGYKLLHPKQDLKNVVGDNYVIETFRFWKITDKPKYNALVIHIKINGNMECNSNSPVPAYVDTNVELNGNTYDGFCGFEDYVQNSVRDNLI